MFKSYWIVAVAFGLVFSSSPVYSQSGVQDGENGSNTNAEQTSKQQKPSFVTAIEGVESAIRELIRAESEEERQRQADQAAQDLEAQAEMAEWAREVGIGTVAGAAFTLIGLILIWVTLGHTRRAADYARDMVTQAEASASAALRAVAVTEDAFLMTERPHIFVSNVKPVMPLFSNYTNCMRNNAIEYFEVEYDVQNHGKTPAVIKSLESSIRLLPSLDGTPEFHGGEVSKFEIIIPAGRTRTATQFIRADISDEELQTIRQSREIYIKDAKVLHIFFYLKVVYDSVVGARDEVMSAFRYDPRVNDFLSAESLTYNYRHLGKMSD